MNKKALFAILFCVLLLLVVLGGMSFFKEKMAGIKDFVLPLGRSSNLEIENYIFTKIGDSKGVVRVYGLNKDEKHVSKFPIEITYYANDQKKLGSDTVDLLAKTQAFLKPGGKLNASVDVEFPKDTHTVRLRVR